MNEKLLRELIYVYKRVVIHFQSKIDVYLKVIGDLEELLETK